MRADVEAASGLHQQSTFPPSSDLSLCARQTHCLSTSRSAAISGWANCSKTRLGVSCWAVSLYQVYGATSMRGSHLLLFLRCSVWRAPSPHQAPHPLCEHRIISAPGLLWRHRGWKQRPCMRSQHSHGHPG